MRSPASTLEHVPALDGIRGAGVAGILLFHAGHLTGGWLGVDLFFVLSGYLITSLLLVEYWRDGSISLGGFWARRARRLLPALCVALLGVALYAVAFAAPADLSRIRSDGIATLMYVANWHAIFAEYEYWALFGAGSPLEHTWSLAIEEQFYLFWPPLCLWLLSVARGSAQVLFRVTLALALCSAAWMALLYDELEGTARVYYGTDTRAVAVLLGAAFAAAHGASRDAFVAHARAFDFAGLVGLAALAVGWTTVGGESSWLYRGGLPMFGVMSALVVAAAVVSREGPVSRVFAWAPLRGLGLVSYGLYLWHWPLYLVLSPERTGLDGVLLTALRLLVSLLVAVASYRWIELPIRRGGLGGRRAWGLAFVGFAATSLALVGATSNGNATAPRVLPQPIEQGRPRVLVVGDSAAERLGPMFDALVAGEPALARGGAPVQVFTRAFPGCSPLVTERVRLRNSLLIEGGFCRQALEFWRGAQSELAPDLIVLVEGAHGLWEREIGGQWRHACDPVYAQQLTDALAEFVSSARADGSAVAIVLMPPVDVKSARAVQASPTESLDELTKIASARMRCQNGARRAAASLAGAELIDLEAHLCPGGACAPGAMSGLREDGIHFSDPGGRPVAEWLIVRFAELLGASSPD